MFEIPQPRVVEGVVVGLVTGLTDVLEVGRVVLVGNIIGLFEVVGLLVVVVVVVDVDVVGAFLKKLRGRTF